MILIADSGSTKTEWTAMDDLTGEVTGHAYTCLLYTSDAADE